VQQRQLMTQRLLKEILRPKCIGEINGEVEHARRIR
jgi:hypothetical protein